MFEMKNNNFIKVARGLRNRDGCIPMGALFQGRQQMCVVYGGNTKDGTRFGPWGNTTSPTRAFHIGCVNKGPLRIVSFRIIFTGGPSLRFGHATPPPPLPALRAHLVTKGQ